MTHAEFLEWQAYWKIEPWGAERESDNAALIAMTLANINRKRNSRPYRLDEFRLKYDRQQTWQQQLGSARQIVAAFGGEIRRR